MPNVTAMGVRRGAVGGGLATLDLKNFSKKSCFLNFEWEKTNFTAFGEKNLEKSPSGYPWKKSFRRPWLRQQL